MKKISNYIIATLSIFLLTQCSEEDVLTTLDLENGVLEAPALTNASTGGGTVLSGENADDIFEVYRWSPATFDGLNIATDYTGQIASIDDFSDAITLFSTTLDSAVVKNSDINAAMLSLGLPANEESTFYVRVVAKAHATSLSDVDQLVSTGVSRTATSYLAVAFPLWLVGNHNGWSNSATTTDNLVLFPDPNNSKQYYYKGYLNGGFKAIDVPGSWATQWGNGGAGVLSTDGGSGNINDGIAGGYFDFSMNIETLTYTLSAIADPGTDYTSDPIGITGDQWGWSDGPLPVELTQSSIDPHLWYKTGVTLTDGGLQFRVASGWSKQWGSTGSNSFPYDQANGTSNLTVKAGTYTVWFHDFSNRFYFIEE